MIWKPHNPCVSRLQSIPEAPVENAPGAHPDLSSWNISERAERNTFECVSQCSITTMATRSQSPKYWEGKSDVDTVCTCYDANQASTSADPVPCFYPTSLHAQRLSQTLLHPSYPLHQQVSTLQQRRPSSPARRRSY